MVHCSQVRFRQQLRFLRRQYLQDPELPFSNVLSEDMVRQALTAIDACWKDRIYTPLVTLWIFLSQALAADQSCSAAVARLIAHRVAHGQTPCSAETGGYCQARKRLPEAFISTVARQTGRALEEAADPSWHWKGRRVYVYDGSQVSMPDTPENQLAYPQPDTQKPGLGFPQARIAAVFSLCCGAILDLGICRYAGKGQSELALLHSLWGIFSPGDVVLTDRLMCAWTEIVMLKGRGIDCVCHLTSHRKADFRRGKRLGMTDHVVPWPKPRRPRSIDKETYMSLPDFLMVREVCFQVKQRGFRTKTVTLATTLLDDKAFSKNDLAELYRARWNAELDLRSLKQTMQMQVLRCRTPELVRKEIWVHLLAYNLIRTISAQAASKHGIRPRSISFKGAVRALEAFQPMIALRAPDSAFRSELYQQLLDAIAVHRVADRPDRVEPRARKRRPKHYSYLSKPRSETQRAMMK